MKILVVHIPFLSLILIYLAQKAEIALLLEEKITIPAQYSDFADMFLKKLVVEIFKYSNIN